MNKKGQIEYIILIIIVLILLYFLLKALGKI
jgi:hypothetical protein